MPLSTFSFERPLPDVSWLRIFGVALLVCLTLIALMEIRLAQLGYHSTVLDSPERWAKERARASQLGEKALILIGASRIQLGIDLDTLRKETGLEPVQLAIDGSSFFPVLQNLANDPTIRGTILIDYYPESIESAGSGDYGSATAFVLAYARYKHEQKSFSLSRIENYLADNLHEKLRSFADAATPLMSLQWRILPGEKASQYLITLPDRSRLADYTLVAMPMFYYKRVVRNLGQERSINPASADIEQTLKRLVNLQQSSSNTAFIKGTIYLRQLIAAISSRGGKVQFVVMPTSGMIREIEDKRHPKPTFLKVFEEEIGGPVLHFENNPTLQFITCPDGSHLDYRDRPKFTAVMARSLEIHN